MNVSDTTTAVLANLRPQPSLEQDMELVRSALERTQNDLNQVDSMVEAEIDRIRSQASEKRNELQQEVERLTQASNELHALTEPSQPEGEPAQEEVQG